MSGLYTNGVQQIATPLTGAELAPFDTQNTQGQMPESVAISTDQLANYARQSSASKANFRNLLDGGEFTVNPWQRGTSFSSIAGTLTYTADRWFAIGGTSSGISVSQQTFSPITTIPGIINYLQWGRASSSTGVGKITLGQVLETPDSYRANGSFVLLSFYAQAGAGYATSTGAGATAPLTVSIVGTNGGSANQTAANAVAGSWTNQATLNTVANGVPGAISLVNLSTTWTRYYVLAYVPTNNTQLAVLFQYTPLGTAVANEYVNVAGIQLEMVSSYATQALAPNYASAVEMRDIQVELEICQRYAFAPGGTVGALGTGAATSTTAAGFLINFPVQMRIAPTALAVTTVGDLSVYTWANASVAALTALTFASSNPTCIHATATVGSGLTSGTPYVLYIATALAGNLVFSADL